jgi:hypothetical protein
MRYVTQLFDELVTFMDKEENAVRQHKLFELLLENQSLLQCSTPSFVYNHTWYSTQAIPTGYGASATMRKWNREIHEVVLPKVMELLDPEDFENMRKKATISNFFSTILPLINHVDDLKQLVPDFWISKLPPIDAKLFNQADPMTAAEIERLKEETKEGFDHLKMLAMRHLLLQKTGAFT